MISRRSGAYLLVAITLGAVIAATLTLPRADLPSSYHNFADHRKWFGIPNFANVVSNALFAVVALWGLVFLSRSGSEERFIESRERWPYVVIFIGLLGTAVGSSYYHLAPDDARLLWDRLPMILVFMPLASAMIAESRNW